MDKRNRQGSSRICSRDQEDPVGGARPAGPIHPDPFDAAPEAMRAPRLLAAAPKATSTLWIQWTLSKRGRPTIVSFCGHLGAGNAEVLVDRLRTALEDRPGRLIFDLTGVTLLDAEAQGAVARAREHAAASNVRLDLVCPAGTWGQAPPDGGDGFGLHACLDDALEAVEA